MLGIPNFEPNFFNDAELFRKTFSGQLNQLIGKKISKFWVMWDEREDEWFPDGPIVVEIEGINYEFSAYKLDYFSLTIDSIDLNKKLDWYGLGNEIPLSWKENGKKEFIKSLNRPIEEIHILTFNFISETIHDKINPENTGQIYETGFMLHGIEFVLKQENETDTENFLSVFNSLDQNGLTNLQVNQNDQINRISVTSNEIE